MPTRTTLKALLALTGATCLLTSHVPPAGAVAAPLEFYYGGQLKARATYDDGLNKFCVRSFGNSASSAMIIVQELVDGLHGFNADISDAGGDTAPYCRTVPNGHEDHYFQWSVNFYNSLGDYRGGTPGDGYL